MLAYMQLGTAKYNVNVFLLIHITLQVQHPRPCGCRVN
jgi:hypothetical protein